jgi:hypothetical protein
MHFKNACTKIRTFELQDMKWKLGYQDCIEQKSRIQWQGTQEYGLIFERRAVKQVTAIIRKLLIFGPCGKGLQQGIKHLKKKKNKYMIYRGSHRVTMKITDFWDRTSNLE